MLRTGGQEIIEAAQKENDRCENWKSFAMGSVIG